MNLKKRLQGFLVTSTLLRSICAYGMDDGAASDLPWEDLAPKVCQFLDSQSFGRFRQVSKIFQEGAQCYRSALPKDQALIDHLKTLPNPQQAFAYLSTYAQHELHADEYFVDAFYKYLEVPQKDRLFLIGTPCPVAASFRVAEDFTRKLNIYVPYGMCLMASWLLYPKDDSLQNLFCSSLQNPNLTIAWTADTQKYAYLFLVWAESRQHAIPVSQEANNVVLYLNDLFKTPHVRAREERKALFLQDAQRLKNYLNSPEGGIPESVEPSPQQKASFESLMEECRNIQPISLVEGDRKILKNYLSSPKHRIPEPVGASAQQRASFIKYFMEGDGSTQADLLLRELRDVHKIEEKLWAEYPKTPSSLRLSIVEKLLDVRRILVGAYKRVAQEYGTSARESTDAARKLGFYERVASYREQIIQKKDKPSTEDYLDCGVSYFHVAQDHPEPLKKAKYYHLAALMAEKVLQKQGEDALEEEYFNCGMNYFYAAQHLTDVGKKTACLRRAAFYYGKTVRGTYRLVDVYTELAKVLTKPNEKAAALALAEALRKAEEAISDM